MAHVASPAINAGLVANEAYAAAFTAGALPMPPGKKLAIVACMDARLHPEKVW
jgi:carbonic anhydrase